MDYHWIEGCLEGEAGAIEYFVCTYQQMVYRLVLSILDDPDEAEDGTQETFLAALRGMGSFQGDSAFVTWLYAIAVNVCRNRLRRRQNKARLHNAMESLFRMHAITAPSIEETILQAEVDAGIWKAIHSLDAGHRIPIILRYYHGLPVSEISRIMGIPDGTVHSRLNSARERLRRSLKEGLK
ncbi:MAG TPA: RNA polymerase sigma factor [Anaerolineales bacterium]|nr:RNA polymerase sigma factor [Anaerolineales bacterium]